MNESKAKYLIKIKIEEHEERATRPGAGPHHFTFI